MPALSSDEEATYAWQITVPGFGEAGQERLRDATVFLSRVGGLGSVVAYELAAAGVGHLILAHRGNIKPSDLNRQILMTHAALGTSRVASASRRLHELNPRMRITAHDENASEENLSRLANGADLIVDCAPLFVERFAMNRFAVEQRIPLVDCAMYELQAQITTILPGVSPCLRCLHPEEPPHWKRRFPVFGAVSGTVGCLGAIEAIKILSGMAPPLSGSLLTMDLRTMQFRTLKLRRRPDCPVCGSTHPPSNDPERTTL